MSCFTAFAHLKTEDCSELATAIMDMCRDPGDIDKAMIVIENPDEVESDVHSVQHVLNIIQRYLPDLPIKFAVLHLLEIMQEVDSEVQYTL